MSALMENQLSIGRIVKLLGGIRRRREVLLVKCSCRKKCSERSNCKCRKSSICCGLLCSCLDCGNVMVEAQGLNELRHDELSSSPDDDKDESDEGQ